MSCQRHHFPGGELCEEEAYDALYLPPSGFQDVEYCQWFVRDGPEKRKSMMV
jgi:hypothetical protein